MSTAITSAPSAASRNACERPCPRPAPVTSATFPSTSPIATLLPRFRPNGATGGHYHIEVRSVQLSRAAYLRPGRLTATGDDNRSAEHVAVPKLAVRADHV